MQQLIDELKAIVGPKGYREGSDIDDKNYRDLKGARKIRPTLYLRPETTDEVSKILSLCHANNQAIAPQGGMTGLVSAAAPMEGEIALGFERMNKIVEVDPYTSTMTVEAGVPLQVVQEKADEAGFLFPLDLGARGSCTIGGNLSTNAGGNRVIRYGMMRDLVLGVEAVLADGTIINGLHKLRKNNSGYDLKQLFIGSEGTLGLITKAVLKLSPKPTSQFVAFCSAENFEQIANLLNHMQSALGSNLSAFEVLWKNVYSTIEAKMPDLNLPLPNKFNFYALVECMGSSADADKEMFENALGEALENNTIGDAVISQSDKDVENIWRIRDATAEVVTKVGYMHSYDVGINVGDMGYFGEEVVKRLRMQWPESTISLFGHIGDGNLHVNFFAGPDRKAELQEVDEVIYTIVRELKGTISAEHGIGLMKRPFLNYCKSQPEIELMKTLKRALDPKGILSPGRIIEIG
jgi:FAD/FMN-containing dehydrogenase